METHDVRGGEFLKQLRAGVSCLCPMANQLCCILEKSRSNLEMMQNQDKWVRCADVSICIFLKHHAEAG